MKTFVNIVEIDCHRDNSNKLTIVLVVGKYACKPIINKITVFYDLYVELTRNLM